MSSDQKLQKFRPERPIYLNEQVTNFRTKDEVLEAIQRLRDRGWLCAYSENSRPFHMSFNDVKVFQEFKKSCKEESIKLHEPLIKPDDIEELIAKDSEGQKMPDAVANSSSEAPDGRIHIETK